MTLLLQMVLNVGHAGPAPGTLGGHHTPSDVVATIWCRVAALYVAERMRNEVVATIAAHYQQLALVAARRAVVRASHRRTMSRRDSTKVSGPAVITERWSGHWFSIRTGAEAVGDLRGPVPSGSPPRL